MEWAFEHILAPKILCTDILLELSLHTVISNIKSAVLFSRDLVKSFTTRVILRLTNEINVKNVWEGIRQLISLNAKDSFKANKLIKVNQEIFFYPKLIVNEFNNYFATMGSRLAAEVRSYGT